MVNARISIGTSIFWFVKNQAKFILYLFSSLNVSCKVTQSSVGFDHDFFLKKKFSYHCVIAVSCFLLACQVCNFLFCMQYFFKNLVLAG